MRFNKIKPHTIITIVLIALIGQSLAIVRTEEAPEWNKESLTAYFKKYKIHFDKNSDYNALMETIKSYKDSVTTNSRLFGSNVDHILSGFKLFLEKKTKLAQNDADDIYTNLRHQLRQLELKGQLTKDRVQAVLDKIRHEVIEQKLMTEAEWKRAHSHFESTYVKPTWYQRVLHLKPDVEDIESSSLKGWVHSVSNSLNHLGTLTKDQLATISDVLYQSVVNSDLNKLGDKAWIEEISHKISQKTQLKKEQLEDIVQAIAREVHAYKVFALDYTGQTKEQAHHWLDKFKGHMWTKVQEIVEPIKTKIPYHPLQYQQPHETWHFYDYKDAHLKYPGQEERLTASIKAQVSSMSKAIEPMTKASGISHAIETAVSAAAQATNSVKGTFAHFWHQKEHDIYRRLGYTEAHIDWIRNYLEHTFQNQKDSVKGRADEAAIALKRYLDSCKVQTPNQVDVNVHRMKRYLEAWRTLVE
ncbi:hypothetical protein G6F37_009177 [Rhizopus arrhizus]|nr:hypothetical protein G6F38_009284 [Rhizopus arrhizus]KAG1154743.1 hypothetical protein G6F37_009177 [Rhizopus arrhizus]